AGRSSAAAIPPEGGSSMFDDSKVSFEIEVWQDDACVRGNAMCSGDDDFDREVEDTIIDRLDGGDVWAWATVRVVARYDGIDDIEGDDYLGCCNYADEADFKAGGYCDDMCDVAKEALIAELERCAAAEGCDDLDSWLASLDPYDGDPRNEIADLASDFHITGREDCPGLKEDHVYVDYETVGGTRKMSAEGPISWVLPILRAARGV
ncbi:MAG: hypothetical protein ACYSWO_29975, partial [Planctomycetota bacterium]